MLPDFICVGPGRAGTSWLYEILREHPGVCLARKIKETEYFNTQYDRGQDWYERFFAYCSEDSAVGEISNRYFARPEVCDRISEAIPDCKIIVCLRNPYDRIQSVYGYQLREGNLDCSFEGALERMPSLIEDNRYYSIFRPYVDTFGRSNVHFVLFDHIVDRPFEVCSQLFSFLGVDPDFVPSKATDRVNRSISPRLKIYGKLAKGIAKALRTMGCYGLLTWAKRQEWLKNLLFVDFRYTNRALMDRSVQQRLDAVFLPELERLETLLDLDLTGWKVGPGGRLT